MKPLPTALRRLTSGAARNCFSSMPTDTARGSTASSPKPTSRKRLIKHREENGQEVSDADRQRWFAYLDVAHIAQQALSPNPPSENSDPDATLKLNPCPLCPSLSAPGFDLLLCESMKARQRERAFVGPGGGSGGGGGFEAITRPCSQRIKQIVGLIFRRRRAVAEIHAVVSWRLLQNEAELSQFVEGFLIRCRAHVSLHHGEFSASGIWAGGKRGRDTSRGSVSCCNRPARAH